MAILNGVVAIAAVIATTGTSPAAAPVLPPANGEFDYQIGSPYEPAESVKIVDRDHTQSPAEGKYNICYVNAFQTQPDKANWWKRNHSNLLLRKNGNFVIDSAWNEILLDTSTADKRSRLGDIVGEWIDSCASKRFQAVELDNLDSSTRSKDMLRASHNKAFASLLIKRAHARGLAVAQKNTSEWGQAGKAMGFDFAIAEECHRYKECGKYTNVYGDQVYEIEYREEGGLSNFQRACKSHGADISITYRDRDVVGKGERGYVYKSC